MNGPSRALAAMAGSETAQAGLEARTGSRESQRNRPREVQVRGTAEARCPADRASVRVGVGSSKESVGEVSNSVSRRLEYILQALRQHDVGDEDTSVRKFLHRDADLYRMDAEVMVTFSDFEKMERVGSILLEKLDRSVCVGTPHFYHSAECLSQMRQRACVRAFENAQQKASRVSQLLGQSLGSPLLVREEETKEWRNEEEEEGGEDGGGRGHIPQIPTVTASSQVSVSFGLRDRSRKKL